MNRRSFAQALSERAPVLFVAAVTLTLLVRYFFLVDSWAANVIFWDQWDFLGGFFHDDDLWTLFRWQHGPHRQGLGALLLRVVYDLTSWNMRVEAFVSASLIVAAQTAFLFLKRRLAGRWDFADAVIPLATLTALQYETFAGPSNPSHGPLPLFLTVATAAALLIRNPRRAAATLCVLSFLSMYTGFALFNGLLAFSLLTVRAVLGDAEHRRTFGAFALIAALGIGSFFVGYRNTPAVACFHFPHERPLEYLGFAVRMFGRSFGTAGEPGSQNLPLEKLLLTGIEYLALWGACGYSGFLVWRSRSTDRAALVVFLLSACTISFGLFSAVGRVCMGLDAAKVSRYVIYEAPGILALYLAAVLWIPGKAWRSAVMIGLLCLLAHKEWRSDRSQAEARYYHDGKVRWAACYLEKHDVKVCNETTGFSIYPVMDEQKLRYLEERKLNFFH